MSDTTDPTAGDHTAENDARCCGQIIGNICPACLLNPCECPIDDSAVRDLFARVIPPTVPATPDAGDVAWECPTLVIGPNTDGEPCDWCQTCGEHVRNHMQVASLLAAVRREAEQKALTDAADDLIALPNPTRHATHTWLVARAARIGGESR